MILLELQGLLQRTAGSTNIGAGVGFGSADHRTDCTSLFVSTAPAGRAIYSTRFQIIPGLKIRNFPWAWIRVRLANIKICWALTLKSRNNSKFNEIIFLYLISPMLTNDRFILWIPFFFLKGIGTAIYLRGELIRKKKLSETRYWSSPPQ